MIDIHFACQGCGSPLKIDESCGSSKDKLLNSYKATPRDVIGHQNNCESTLNAKELETKLGLLKYDYSNLDSTQDETQLSADDKALDDLFDKLTTELGIDHPLCQDCSNKVIRHLDKVTEKIEKEYDEYCKLTKILHQKFDSEESPITTTCADEEEQLACLLEEENNLQGKLDAIDAERGRVLTEIESYSQKIADCENEITKYQKRTIDIQDELFSLEMESKDLDYAILHCQDELKYLSSTNALDMAFSISFDGHCGTINGFRLAYIPSSQISLSELNAALGLTAFLQQVLFRHRGLSHPQYEIMPLGSTSSVKYRGLTKTSVFPLHLSEIKKIPQNSPFNEALFGLLRCLELLVDHITEHDPSYEFPNTIVDDHILTKDSKLSIRFMGTDDVTWTKSMKALLLILKAAVGWCSRTL